MGWLCCWNIFYKSLYFQMYFFQIKISILSFHITVIFLHFNNVFVLDSLKISSVLNSPLTGPRWRARSHIVLKYNKENMRFIRFLLTNQIAYIFCFNDKNMNGNNNLDSFILIKDAPWCIRVNVWLYFHLPLFSDLYIAYIVC